MHLTININKVENLMTKFLRKFLMPKFTWGGLENIDRKLTQR